MTSQVLLKLKIFSGNESGITNHQGGMVRTIVGMASTPPRTPHAHPTCARGQCVRGIGASAVDVAMFPLAKGSQTLSIGVSKMTQSKIPAYVSKAATGYKNAQFNFIMSASIWAYVQQIGGTPGTGAAMARAIIAEHPALSEKTVANYCSTGVVLARQHAQVLASFWADSNNKPTDVLALFAAWVKTTTASKGYTLSEPDLRAHADKKPSQAAKAQAEKEAQAAIASAAAVKASEPTKPDALPAGIVKTEGEKVDPVTLETVPANPAAPVDAPKVDTPKVAEPAQPVSLFTARRMPDGTLSVVISAGITRDDLIMIGLHVETALQALPARVETEAVAA